jgi:hypothetical protein
MDNPGPRSIWWRDATCSYCGRLLDAVAVQDEHSHVAAELRQRLGELILPAAEREPLEDTARRIAHALKRDELAAIVAHWLEAQVAI